jgi:hypothetical protein
MKRLIGSVLGLSIALAFQTSTANAAQHGKRVNPNTTTETPVEEETRTDTEETPRTSYEKLPLQQLQFGGNYRKFDYVEGNNLDSETGNMPGITLGYQIDLERLYAAALLTIVSSHTTYNGSDQSGTIPVTSKTNTQLIEFEANVGIPLTSPGAFIVKAYTGLGYHYWRRGDAGVTNGVSSYREDYSWLVLPLGIRFEQTVSDSFKVSLDAAARLSSNGVLDVKLSQIGDYQDPHLNLGAKMGYKIQLPIDLKVTPRMHLVATPFYEYSAIGQSDPTELRTGSGVDTGTAILEPESRTKQTGGTLVLTYIL